MNFRISTVAAIAKVDEQSIVDAARLFGLRRVGPFLCVSRPLPPAFFAEVLSLQKMKDAADARRNKRNATVCVTPMGPCG
jgi:hypothetical protein